jgi:ribonucleoside-diphosphate reductase alpha chain
MRIARRYTKEGQSPYTEIEFRLTMSEIRNPDGSVVFRAENVEVPATPEGRRGGGAGVSLALGCG